MILDIKKHNLAEKLGAEYDKAMKAWKAAPSQETAKILALAWTAYDRATTEAIADLKQQAEK